jgi:hypothetical protein
MKSYRSLNEPPAPCQTICLPSDRSIIGHEVTLRSQRIVDDNKLNCSGQNGESATAAPCPR